MSSLTLYNPVVTLCTTCFNTKSLHFAHTLYLCVPYDDEGEGEDIPVTGHGDT
jgi:hypothetical protein